MSVKSLQQKISSNYSHREKEFVVRKIRWLFKKHQNSNLRAKNESEASLNKIYGIWLIKHVMQEHKFIFILKRK